MFDIDALKYDEKGLIPAIVVDSGSGKVLTLAYMNRESLRISMEKGLTCFWSRSRNELWLKGETSGNYQHIVSITADCDRDALVVEVVKDGPACHLGTDSCFGERIFQGETPPAFSCESLMDLLKGRKEDPPAGSYTSYLFEKVAPAQNAFRLMNGQWLALKDGTEEINATIAQSLKLLEQRAWTRSSKKSGRSARRSSSPPRTGTSPIRSTSWRISPITRWC